MARTLKEVLHDQVHLSDVPIKVQAEELGISYSGLANAVNPDLPEFQFQLRHFLSLCHIGGRTDALDYMEAALGRVAFSLPTATICHQQINGELATCFKEFGEFGEVAAKAINDNHISSSEAKRIEKELLDLVQQAMGFLRLIQEAALR